MANCAFLVRERFTAPGLLLRVDAVPDCTLWTGLFFRPKRRIECIAHRQTNNYHNQDFELVIEFLFHQRRPLFAGTSSGGRPNAMYSPEYAPPLTATIMYCLPLSM